MGNVQSVQTKDDLIIIKDQLGVDRSTEVSDQFDTYKANFDGMGVTTDTTLSASAYLST